MLVNEGNINHGGDSNGHSIIRADGNCCVWAGLAGESVFGKYPTKEWPCCIEQLGKALVWQAHSVRGAIAGALKKKSCVVSSVVADGGSRTYRIA